VGVCFDVGHAHIMSDIPQAFEILKSHIRSTHIHDNAGDRDAHLWPGKGKIQWKETMELLRSAPHTPPLVLEIEGDEKISVPDCMGEAFRKLEES
jgi:sugar phosphate isomerase/epimerase